MPPPFPPDPPLDFNGLYQLDRANQALGRLDGLTTLLPDTRLFLYLYVRKEALLSSQIEGTKSSFSDLLLFENEAVPGVPIDDVEEVSNYVAAMQNGLRRIKGRFPLSLRYFRVPRPPPTMGDLRWIPSPGRYDDQGVKRWLRFSHWAVAALTGFDSSISQGGEPQILSLARIVHRV